MDDEPLEQWARRREKNRRPVGRRRAVIIGDTDYAASHVHPDRPRAIEEWDGYQWVPVAIVDDYAAAQRFLAATSPPATEGTGRHRDVARGRHRRT